MTTAILCPKNGQMTDLFGHVTVFFGHANKATKRFEQLRNVPNSYEMCQTATTTSFERVGHVVKARLS